MSTLSTKRFSAFTQLQQHKMVFVLLFVFAAYFLWEWYWYTQVGLAVVKWHTHLTLIVLPLLLAISFLLTTQSSIIQNILLGVTSFLFCLLGVEVICIVTGINKTYLEKSNGYYHSLYNTTGASYYHVLPPNATSVITKPEYTLIRSVNPLGFPDKVWNKQPDKRKKRILCLGDSFTEGDGATQDSCYVALLEQMLNIDSVQFECLNAGTLGSDPFFNFINLKDRLVQYHPNYVLQTLSSGDITADLATRGGLSRFQANKTLRYRSAPWWEPLYAISYTSRFFLNTLGYNEYLINTKNISENKEKYNEEIITLIEAYEEVLEKNNLFAYIIIRPEKNEVLTESAFDFSKIILAIHAQKNMKVINLFPHYKSFFNKKKTALNDYFWPIDGHHNAKGYHLMATFIHSELFEKGDDKH